MSIRLKICGITALDDARYCAAKGADYLGFIQYPESPRYIEPRAAAQIIEWVYGPAPVGVFVNATADDVNRAANEAGFEIVQLHGEEPVFEVASIERPVIKALRIQPKTTEDALRRQFQEYGEVVDYFLLDTFSRRQMGGTGEVFDWSIARSMAAEYDLFLAGGIDASNVAEAVKVTRPFALDVSSSIETAPGSKDFEKIDAFMDAFEEVRSESRVQS